MRESTHALPNARERDNRRSTMPEKPPAPTVTDNLYALVTYLQTSYNRELLDAIAREQLTFTQLQLLERLRGGYKPTIRQVATILHVTPAGASRIVEGLARRGLVLRETAEADGRAKRVSITPRGEEVFPRLHAARLDRIQAFARDLSDEERKQLDRALSKLAERDPIAACRPATIAA